MNAKTLPSKSAGSNSSASAGSSMLSTAISGPSVASYSLASSVACWEVSADLMDIIDVGPILVTNAWDMQWMACSIQHACLSFATHRLQVGSTLLARMAITLSHTVEPSTVPQLSLSGSTNLYSPRMSIRSVPVFSPEWSLIISQKARTCSCKSQLVSIQ